MRQKLKLGLLLEIGLLACLPALAWSNSFLVLGGHMYGLTPDKKPCPGFQAIVDSLPHYGPDAYIAAGDCTFSGAAAEWDSLQATYAGKWSFPFVPVLGNHDSENMVEWYSRWGDDTWRSDYDSTRVLFLWSSQSPNGNPDQEHFNFIVNELAQAASDPSVSDLLIVQHHLAWVKTNPRYEVIREMGNAWYDEFSTRGYDVNAFFDELWPHIKAVAQVKPVTMYCGDTGYTDLVPGIFFDVLDGVTLIATGYHAAGAANNDAVVFYRSSGGNVSLELYSPWGTVFNPLQSYNLAYWTAQLAAPADPVPTVTPGPQPPFVSDLPSGVFDMGDHVDPRYETYQASTGYTVTLSPFVMSVTEITVAQYLAFLNDTGSNLYAGFSCVDLADAQCQIEYAAGVYSAKDSVDVRDPIVEVSWYGALGYCNWRSQLDGKDPAYDGVSPVGGSNGWRLPTDAEFEYAMRGGYGSSPTASGYSRFWWGDDSPGYVHDYANYYGTGGADVWEGLAPVGSFPPNLFGLRDMAGNAFEWCADPWTWSGELSGSVNDPLESGSIGYTQYRVIRGGGYNFDWAGCRNGYRSGELANESQSYIGFRIARSGSDVVTSGPAVTRIPVGVALNPAVPNPFNPRTTLRFELPPGIHRAELSIYDARGRLVRHLKSGDGWPSDGQVIWDGTNDRGSASASGSYFAVLKAGIQQGSQKLSLIR
jgi:formylglycine-generating enzyme required for sulfatase activity